MKKGIESDREEERERNGGRYGGMDSEKERGSEGWRVRGKESEREGEKDR